MCACFQRDSVISGIEEFFFFTIKLLVIIVWETVRVGYFDKLPLKNCYVCIVVNEHVQHKGHVEVRGRFCRVTSLLPLHGFWELNSCCQDSMVRCLWLSHLALYWQTVFIHAPSS